MAGTAVITGGEGGLARAIAVALGAAGYDVLSPGRGELDVCDAEAVAAYFGKLEGIDLLVNNAGVARHELMVKMEDAVWEEVVATNLRGAFLCSRAAVKLMARARRGHILNIGSYTGTYGAVGQANYAAAKSGLIGLTKSVALEMGKRGVRANVILPGFLETKMTAHLSEAQWAEIMEGHALDRLNTVEDVATFVVAVDGMEAVSGQVFQLDSRVGRQW
ncbi:MAG: SDR family NAD(P)-dependent oxidoreductase [Verrucomicrobiota bacterium]